MIVVGVRIVAAVVIVVALVVVVVVIVVGVFVVIALLFQLIFTRFLGGPIGGICCVASARNASAIKCECVVIIFCQPEVSITSVA